MGGDGGAVAVEWYLRLPNEEQNPNLSRRTTRSASMGSGAGQSLPVHKQHELHPTTTRRDVCVGCFGKALWYLAEDDKKNAIDNFLRSEYAGCKILTAAKWSRAFLDRLVEMPTASMLFGK